MRPFTPAQIKLLETFADQAVIAIENVRLFKELETRAREFARSVGELRALGAVSQAVSSTLDLATVLATIVGQAVQLWVLIAASSTSTTSRRRSFICGPATKWNKRWSRRFGRHRYVSVKAPPVGQLRLGCQIKFLTLRQREDTPTRVRPTLMRLGYRSLLSVPLLLEQQIMGGLTVSRRQTGQLAPEVMNLLQTFATQSVLAIQNARLFREIEEKSSEIEAANRHKSEFLANMSHELRTPLNAIIGFSEVLGERMFGELNEERAEYTDDILSSGRHLLSLINEILDLSKVEAGRMELEVATFDLPMANRQRAHVCARTRSPPRHQHSSLR